MKLTIYIVLILFGLTIIGYVQNEYTDTMANKKEKHPYINNIKKSLSID